MVLLITKAVQYLLVALAFALICRGSVRTTEGKIVSMAESFYIAVYARTLAAVIGSANIALGYMIDSFVLMIVTVFITMGFIMRGESSSAASDVYKRQLLCGARFLSSTHNLRRNKAFSKESILCNILYKMFKQPEIFK